MTSAARRDHADVDFWLDPSCPFTWITSTWLRQLDPALTRIHWRLMSLAILNADADITDDYRAIMAQTIAPLRVLAAAGEVEASALGRLYAAMGRRRHEEHRPYDRAVFDEALRECELDPVLADAADDARLDDVVAASHRAAQASAGEASGSPITAFDGRAGFFGPVLSATPSGEEGERVLQACRALASTRSFTELKRARTVR